MSALSPVHVEVPMAGKVWFVTGGSRGLGRAIVQAALQAGDRVVATARRPEQLAGLAAEHGQSVLVLPLDVTEDDMAASAAEATVARFGRIDVLVNNAGYATLAAVEDLDMDGFRTQVNTNLLGVVTVTKAVLPVMRQQRSGHKISQAWFGEDVLGMLLQLGVVTLPG
jgi:NAD(P)-dependent dehydrogenase (short-subunit alcohol dehydrogenase family)